jgi:hypothetical protein
MESAPNAAAQGPAGSISHDGGGGGGGGGGSSGAVSSSVGMSREPLPRVWDDDDSAAAELVWPGGGTGAATASGGAETASDRGAAADHAAAAADAAAAPWLEVDESGGREHEWLFNSGDSDSNDDRGLDGTTGLEAAPSIRRLTDGAAAVAAAERASSNAGNSAAPNAAKRARTAAGASAGRLPPPVPPPVSAAVVPSTFNEVLDTQTVYRLLADESQLCSGRRPDFLCEGDLGKVYIERSSGKVPLVRKRRRPGTDKWIQGTKLQPRQIDDHDQRQMDSQVEVWLRTVYGTIQREQSGLQAQHSRVDALPSFKYHQYELHFYRAGSTNVPSVDGAAHAKRQGTTERADTPDWAQGTLYHVRTNSGRPIKLETGGASSGSVSSRTRTQIPIGPVEARPPPLLTRSGAALDLQLQPSDDRWIQLKDVTGKDSGALLSGPHGPTLTGSSGDFAEWHVRDPSEMPFDEGDVVALGEHGLTRSTRDARQLGVISRRAIVAGSRPDSSMLPLYDQVAYTGRVPVKLRGAFRHGDFVVPSGSHDGTAIAVREMPKASVGQTLEGKGMSTARQSLRCFGICCGRQEKLQSWSLVTIGVHAPALTVRETRAAARRSKAFLLALVALLLASLVLYYYSTNRTCSEESVNLSRIGACSNCGAHGSSTIMFKDKDAVVTFARAQMDDESIRVDCPTGFSGQVYRRCLSSGSWGKVLGNCSRRHCPSFRLPLARSGPMMGQEETRACLDEVSREHLTQRCLSVREHSVTIEAAAEGRTGVTPCPWPGYSGNIHASCVANSNEWSNATVGCKRQVCPAAWVDVSMGATDATDATYRAFLPEQQRTRSPAQPPETCVEDIVAHESATTWMAAACCNEFSYTGSCLDKEPTFGAVAARCDETGRRHVWDVNSAPSNAWAALQCASGSTVAAKLDQSPETAAMLYRALIENVADELSKATGGAWRLPSTGVLAGVSVALKLPGKIKAAPEWRSVNSATADEKDEAEHDFICWDNEGNIGPDCRRLPVTIDTTTQSRNVVSGRAVAAFADTSCRQLGYRRAVMVTNCMGIQRLKLDRIPEADRISFLANATDADDAASNSHEIFDRLCPELAFLKFLEDRNTNGPWDIRKTDLSWLEVRKTTDAGDTEWLQYISQHRGSQSAFELYDPATPRVGPLPTSSSCSGQENDLAACFTSQIENYRQGKRSTQYHRPSFHKLIVGCSNDEDKTTSKGTWVVSDGVPDDQIIPEDDKYDVHSPTIVTGLGVYNCSTGAELMPGDNSVSGARSAELCWGKALEVPPLPPPAGRH